MKKGINVIKRILVAAIAIIAICVMIFTIISVTTFDRNDRDLFGYRAYIVTSDSMSATDFSAGDLIIVKQVDPATLQEGDIISFVSQESESYGQTITHKIAEVTTDSEGAPGFVTYGTTTGSIDQTIVTYEYVLGKYQLKLPKVGTFFNFLRTPQGYIVCIFVPFMILIIYQGLNCIRLFRRYKNEQMEELKLEKEKVKEEREETAKMMAEMMALKAQMQQQSGAPVQPVQPAQPVAPTPQPEVQPVAPAPTPVQPAPQPQARPTQSVAPTPQPQEVPQVQPVQPIQPQQSAPTPTPEITKVEYKPAAPAPQPQARPVQPHSAPTPTPQPRPVRPQQQAPTPAKEKSPIEFERPKEILSIEEMLAKLREESKLDK
ncbi:MAG: signal peptidase I [Firmicutes bacterium]|nr:signal peptidase I [Bacillota bacterium]MBR3788079.1 signal peptidase I [Bacillota bacterium]